MHGLTRITFRTLDSKLFNVGMLTHACSRGVSCPPDLEFECHAQKDQLPVSKPAVAVRSQVPSWKSCRLQVQQALPMFRDAGDLGQRWCLALLRLSMQLAVDGSSDVSCAGAFGLRHWAIRPAHFQ